MAFLSGSTVALSGSEWRASGFEDGVMGATVVCWASRGHAHQNHCRIHHAIKNSMNHQRRTHHPHNTTNTTHKKHKQTTNTNQPTTKRNGNAHPASGCCSNSNPQRVGNATHSQSAAPRPHATLNAVGLVLLKVTVLSLML